MKRVLELQEKRNQVVADIRALADKIAAEKRDAFNTEETEQYNKLLKSQDDLRNMIAAETRIGELEKEMRSPAAGQSRADVRPGEQSDGEGRSSKAYQDMFRGYIKRGGSAIAAAAEEVRALSASSLTDGGALLAPENFVTSLLMKVDDMVFIRAKATKQQIVNSVSVGVPTIDTDPADADWTTEIATGSEDTALKFGKRSLTPQPMAKRVKVSNFLLQNSAIPVENIIRDRLAYKFGITQEKAFLTGNGSNQPLGVFTASSFGISTGRDVTCGSSSAPTFDGLYDMKYALKGNYWGKAEWLFHRDALKLIAKLKDTTNQYIWQPSQQVGQPDKLLGLPFNMSEYVPNTFTTGLYVAMLGDFSFYWIADVLNLTIQRLVELYAETNQVGFIGRLECDGMPALEEAFVRGKLA